MVAQFNSSQYKYSIIVVRSGRYGLRNGARVLYTKNVSNKNVTNKQHAGASTISFPLNSRLDISTSFACLQ